jgi:hypothetical protein
MSFIPFGVVAGVHHLTVIGLEKVRGEARSGTAH